jgi:hypothetical protein
MLPCKLQKARFEVISPQFPRLGRFYMSPQKLMEKSETDGSLSRPLHAGGRQAESVPKVSPCAPRCNQDCGPL